MIYFEVLARCFGLLIWNFGLQIRRWNLLCCVFVLTFSFSHSLNYVFILILDLWPIFIMCRYTTLVLILDVVVNKIRPESERFKIILDEYLEYQFEGTQTYKSLMKCLKHYFGDLDKVKPNDLVNTLKVIMNTIQKASLHIIIIMMIIIIII